MTLTSAPRWRARRAGCCRRSWPRRTASSRAADSGGPEGPTGPYSHPLPVAFARDLMGASDRRPRWLSGGCHRRQAGDFRRGGGALPEDPVVAGGDRLLHSGQRHRQGGEHRAGAAGGGALGAAVVRARRAVRAEPPRQEAPGRLRRGSSVILLLHFVFIWRILLEEHIVVPNDIVPSYIQANDSDDAISCYSHGPGRPGAVKRP
jgi:hypothetical protein